MYSDLNILEGRWVVRKSFIFLIVWSRTFVVLMTHYAWQTAAVI